MKTDRVKPSPQTLTCLLEKVLRSNNFTFNDEHFIEIKGTAMGTRVAPNFANVYMGRFEENFVYKTEWSNYVIIWVRFIGDIFLIWKGDRDSLTEFIDHLNNAAPSIKFTHMKYPLIQLTFWIRQSQRIDKATSTQTSIRT